MENFKDYTIIAGNIVICFTGIVATWKLWVMRKSFLADHERRKKQATVEFFHNIDNECDLLLNKIDEKFPDGRIINVCDVENDTTMLTTIIDYLTRMERLAVGVNTGIYDIAVFDRMAGEFTIKWFDRVYQIIIYRRKFRNASHAYMDFEDLVFKLREVRKKRFPRHDKDFAKMKYYV
ncbi:MAG: DUF4760 domain-containing protein [Chitinivibrionia bacterium]|nr:DUF4760 domain-containing protein [Chitinivibrionia bacterium]